MASRFVILSHVLSFGPVRGGWNCINQPRKGDSILAGTPRGTSALFPGPAAYLPAALSCTGE